MALRYQLRTFIDIINAVCETAKVQSGDTVSRNRIRRNINTIYMDEVIPYRQWTWLRSAVNLTQPTYYSTGTALVTENSVAVTLSTGPALSYKGYLFSVDGDNNVYRIASHTAAGTAVVLEVPYAGDTTAAATIKIWSDALVLPPDCKETIDASHSYSSTPMESLGLQEFRRHVVANPKHEGRPSVYTTTDFKDPSPFDTISGLPASATRVSAGLVKTIKFNATLGATEAALLLKEGDQIEVTGAGSYTYNARAVVSSVSTTSATNDTITYTVTTPLVESSTADTGITVKKLGVEGFERYRELLIYPSLMNERTTMHLDYIRQAVALEGDTDEPLMSLEDRIVLYYGALWLTWTRERNPEEANINMQLFQKKLDRMAGKSEDSTDKPVLVPSRRYLASKRSSRSNRFNWKAD